MIEPVKPENELHTRSQDPGEGRIRPAAGVACVEYTGAFLFDNSRESRPKAPGGAGGFQRAAADIIRQVGRQDPGTTHGDYHVSEAIPVERAE